MSFVNLDYWNNCINYEKLKKQLYTNDKNFYWSLKNNLTENRYLFQLTYQRRK